MSRTKRGKQSALSAFAERPAPRPQVTRGQVVERALEVLHDDGFDGLTMRRLAERLGIKAASLYNHVADKDELLALLADAICAEIPALDSGLPWRAQLEAMAHQTRRVLLEHRDGAQVLAATPPGGPNRLRLIEEVLRALVKAGFPPDQIADASFVLNSYIVGFVIDETLSGPGPASSQSQRKMRDEGRRWFKSLPPDQYPTVIALADALVDATPARRFEFGLRALLDGLALRLQPSTSRARR